MANKVFYGIENCYYALATLASDNSATYGAPKALPGARGITLDPEGELYKFFADNMVYYENTSNNGYSGSLELAMITDEFREDILGEEKNATKGLRWEVQDVEPKHFALIFEFRGDVNRIRHVLYNCTASRPSIAGSTKEETIEPGSQTIDISAASIYVPELLKNAVKGRADEGSTSYNAFFTSVQIPTTT